MTRAASFLPAKVVVDASGAFHVLVNFRPSAGAIARTSSRDAAAIRNNHGDMADAPMSARRRPGGRNTEHHACHGPWPVAARNQAVAMVIYGRDGIASG